MTLFRLWDLPGDVLAAPESASGLDRCNISLSLSLSLSAGLMPGMCWIGVISLSVSLCVLLTLLLFNPGGCPGST